MAPDRQPRLRHAPDFAPKLPPRGAVQRETLGVDPALYAKRRQPVSSAAPESGVLIGAFVDGQRRARRLRLRLQPVDKVGPFRARADRRPHQKPDTARDAVHGEGVAAGRRKDSLVAKIGEARLGVIREVGDPVDAVPHLIACGERGFRRTRCKEQNQRRRNERRKIIDRPVGEHGGGEVGGCGARHGEKQERLERADTAGRANEMPYGRRGDVDREIGCKVRRRLRREEGGEAEARRNKVGQSEKHRG